MKECRRLVFEVVIPPKAQQRARSCARHGRAFTFKSPSQKQEEDRLIVLLYEHRPAVPLEGPLRLGVKAFLPIPESKSKKWKAMALCQDIRPTGRPDLDNLIKHFKDCATGIFWKDDKQIVEYSSFTGKYYGSPARWEIEIEEL